MEYYDERFPAGAYVEGFVRLTGLETGNLNVPFLAFYGEFDDAPILETGSAASLLGGEHAYGTADHIHNQLVGSVKIYEELNANSAYQAEHILGDTRDALSVKVPRKDFRFDLMWEWAMPFYHEHQGISPNSDGNLDYFTWKYALRRNAENIHYTVTNRQTGEVIFEQDTGFVAKTFNKTYAAGVEMSLDITLDEKPQETPEETQPQQTQPDGQMPSGQMPGGSYEDWFDFFSPFFGK